MGFFNWTHKPAESDAIYSVMNDDHVELYRLVGELQDNVIKRCTGETERSVQQMEVLAAIRKLIAKAAEHFHRENLLMEQYRYPEHREHRDEHAMLLCSIETWSSNLASSGRPITKEVVHYLKDWLTNHIRTADRRLDRFLISAVRKLGPPGPLAAGTSEAGWTAENTLLWASFHDTVARETVADNRRQSRTRARREQRLVQERRNGLSGWPTQRRRCAPTLG